MRDLLRNALPEKIVRELDLDTIELSDDSFIDEKLSLYQSEVKSEIPCKIENGHAAGFLDMNPSSLSCQL